MTGPSPYAITIDSAGNLYTANFASHDVTKVTDASVAPAPPALPSAPRAEAGERSATVTVTPNAVDARFGSPAGTDPAAPRLATRLAASRRVVVAGQRLRIRISVRNDGTATAAGTTARIALPRNLVPTDAGGAAVARHTACFSIGALAPGGQSTRQITVRAWAATPASRRIAGRAQAKGGVASSAAPLRVTVLARPGTPGVTGEANARRTGRCYSPARARSMAAMSIFPMVIIAS